ncbi:FAD-dependent oxidoreductase [Solirubrobacter phytolaccae]|uniref:FAD-dependent oxidoreductase n=1 Tax=Solirubrobacter phytolaccae TaxID=1404360 RepID=A0A9X3ND68_9ACTN|nr:FAD-dependent oxidoreductase [Solirubrobacter phytolaccae]MDA0181886.1 FAD-dependent oxidoreductase [Solirubrobacter phytolaccae]
MPTSVLIAGGGPAAVEAALALGRLAGDRVAVTLLAPEADLTYRPLSVLSPFAAGGATTYSLDRIAADVGFTHLRGRLASVDPVAHEVTTVAGSRLSYDALLIASGARPVEPFAAATAFTGSKTAQERLHGIVQDIEEGYLKRIAFVVPPGTTWPLPLYELALMLAERAFQMGVDAQIHLVTPEAGPLDLFGEDASTELSFLLAQAGIMLHAGVEAEIVAPGRVRAGETLLDVERIVSAPRLEGPKLPGLPADPAGFLPTDAHSRVLGAPDVYAAGDVTDYPVKQGGIACQQADAAAAEIAARAGAPVTPEPFTPVLRGMLLTERWARYMRSGEVAGRALWWPPAKIAGRELAGYVEGLDAADGRPAGTPVNVPLGTGTDAIEVLGRV